MFELWSLSCVETGNFFFHWMALIKVSLEEAAFGSYLLVLRMTVENIEG